MLLLHLNALLKNLNALVFSFVFFMAYAAAPLYPASFESTISDLIICACILCILALIY